ncbi:hypothetical protein [Marinibactrum halimedae]|uniref:Ceramidase n=1 Tax=Marinibactrum halimedae TaxID=1444977 RepID=A0AA37T140_9GAMM|nr:hypothetical protein [Marinibactrum halimedae]MCD9460648.1 hypothetical protein [Marinibactrum halimedae]GLS24293.1 hypothetical protein GCM10007877_00040 [Marinibactrum halimedae]
MIDLYCERLGAGLWAEPFNAVSNLSFFIAAWCLHRLISHTHTEHIATRGLEVLLFAIALGSSAFHTFATQWALFADSTPIALFQLWFLAVYSYYVMKWNGWQVGLFIVSFFLCGVGIGVLKLDMNGSEGYLPPLLYLLGLGVYHFLKKLPESFLLLAAGAVFALSLTFRTIDDSICGVFPLGTHFLWHLLNGVVLYLCARAFVLVFQAQQQR